MDATPKRVTLADKGKQRGLSERQGSGADGPQPPKNKQRLPLGDNVKAQESRVCCATNKLNDTVSWESGRTLLLLTNTKIMNKLNVLSFSDYVSVRYLAHGVKDGDCISIDRAAEMMAHLVSCAADENSVIIPIPGRTGETTYMRAIADRISELTGVSTWDNLRSQPHISQYIRKRKFGISGMSLLNFFLKESFPQGVTPILIDNVLDTGTTAMSALRALNSSATLVVLGNTENYRLYNYPISVFERSLTLH